MKEFDEDCFRCSMKQRQIIDSMEQQIKVLEYQNNIYLEQLGRRLALEPMRIVVDLDNYNSIKKIIENNPQ